jgi:hypothetical protein
MYKLKKMERYLPVNLLGHGPRLMKIEYNMLQDFISPAIDN